VPATGDLGDTRGKNPETTHGFGSEDLQNYGCGKVRSLLNKTNKETKVTAGQVRNRRRMVVTAEQVENHEKGGKHVGHS
jgi:hypothetical protein